MLEALKRYSQQYFDGEISMDEFQAAIADTIYNSNSPDDARALAELFGAT